MKHILRSLAGIAFMFFSASQGWSQNIILDFTNKHVSADGLSWTFDLEGKGDAATNYGGIQDGSWIAFNIRLDLELPAGVSILGGTCNANPATTNGSGGVQTAVPGSPPFGQTELGLTLGRSGAQPDLNTTTFVKLATCTINFSGPVNQGNPATPRPNAIQSGSSWTNAAQPIRRPFVMQPSFPLPVKLITFDAKQEGSIAKLTWSTSEESNSDRFDVERSANGKDWKVIGSKKATGESSTIVGYFAIDDAPLNGANLYRLHMIDKDGSSTYSKIQSVDFALENAYNVYPNPVATELNIKAERGWGNLKMVEIIDSRGIEVFSSRNVKETLDVSGLSNGAYILKLTNKNGDSVNRKFLVIK